MQKIKSAGLENYIGQSVVVEDKYCLQSVIGYGATSAVYRAETYEHEAQY